MTNRIVMKLILGISLVLFMGTTTWAYISGTSTTQTSCTAYYHSLGLCSIQIEGILKGLKNVTKYPTAFTAQMLLLDGAIYCLNPAGNAIEGNGVPFQGAGIENGATKLNPIDVTKNGKAIADIVFHDQQLIDAVVAAQCGTDQSTWPSCTFFQSIQCQNSNWIQTIVITGLDVLAKQYSDTDGNTAGGCDIDTALSTGDFSACEPPTDAEGEACSAPDVDPRTLVWQQFTYTCQEFCHDFTGTQCPASLQ